MIADALSNYGRSPDGLLRVFLDVKLIGRNLVDINKLAYYVYLQKIILSHNKIIGTLHLRTYERLPIYKYIKSLSKNLILIVVRIERTYWRKVFSYTHIVQ